MGMSFSGGTVPVSGGTFSGAVSINVNSATALRVEQDGVNDNTLLVDTASGDVTVGTQANSYADDGTAPPEMLVYKKVKVKPWTTTSYGGGLNINNFELDWRSGGTVFGDHAFRWIGVTGFGVSNGWYGYISASGSIQCGKSICSVPRNNQANTNNGDDFRYLPNFYESNGTTDVSASLQSFCDGDFPALSLNAGSSGQANSYAMLVGFSNTVNPNTTLTADVGTFAMEKTGAMYWSAGSSITRAQLPGANSGFDTTLQRSAAGVLTINAGANQNTARLGGRLNTNTTAVGNVGGGTDDLMSYTMPANVLNANNKSVKIKAWGTTANNANPKTVTLNWGSTTAVTKILTVSVAGRWIIEATVVRTSSGNQDIIVSAWNSHGTTVSGTDGNTVAQRQDFVTSAQTDTSTIVIKCTGTVTDGGGGINNDDIVQEGLYVECTN